MVKLLLCLVIAYISIGIGKVTEDLNANPLQKPFWAIQPTFGNVILFGATWILRPFTEASHSDQFGRTLAFGLLASLIDLAILTALVWLSFMPVEYITQNFTAQAFMAFGIYIFAGRFILPFIMPLITIVSMPLVLILTLLLELLFPKRKQ